VAQDPKLAIAYMYLTDYSESPEEFVSNLAKAKENLGAATTWENLYYELLESRLKGGGVKRLAIAEKMVAQFPAKARAYVLLGDAYSELQDGAKARENYQRALALEPSWPGSYTSLISSFLFQKPKDVAQAEATALKLLALAPSAATHITLGDVYRGQNDLAKAESEYSKAIAMDGTSPVTFYKRGHVNAFLGNYEKARADYDEGAKLDVATTDAQNWTSFTYLYAGQPQKALQAVLNDAKAETKGLDKAKAVAAKSTFLYTAAMIAMHIRDAKTLQQIIVEMKPVTEQLAAQVGTDEIRREYMAGVMINEAIGKALNKDFKGARQKAEEMKTLMLPLNHPRKEEDYHYISGYISLQQQDFAKAAVHFEKVSAEDIYSRYLLAKAYEGKGEKDKAHTIYQELANYNFNGVGYALIRNELKKKM
jgi:tetratricopeptide (TPR) repeat protein